MDLAGEGPYFETRDKYEYIKRSDCWRLRRLPPAVEHDLFYRRDPFTPWSHPATDCCEIVPLEFKSIRIASDMP